MLHLRPSMNAGPTLLMVSASPTHNDDTTFLCNKEPMISIKAQYKTRTRARGCEGQGTEIYVYVSRARRASK